MKYSIEQMERLRKELKQITKEAEKGAISFGEAADKIIEVRAEMDRLIEELRNKAKSSK